MEHLKFPIGRFKKPEVIDKQLLETYIKDIEDFPTLLLKEVETLNDAQLDTQYRPEGWAIRQVVHHCADSHMNCFIRFKLALTEEKPTIKPYFEDKWAELSESKFMPIDPSLKIIEGVHERWTVLLKNLSESDLKRVFIHPEHGREISLEEAIALYSWHSKHHLAHITHLKKEKNW